jgi:hypothetical protein
VLNFGVHQGNQDGRKIAFSLVDSQRTEIVGPRRQRQKPMDEPASRQFPVRRFAEPRPSLRNVFVRKNAILIRHDRPVM